MEEEEGRQTQSSVLRKGNQLGRWEQAVVTPVGRTEGARDCPGRLVRVHNSVSCSFYVPCVLLCSKPFDGFDLVQFSKIPETNSRRAHPPQKKSKKPNQTKSPGSELASISLQQWQTEDSSAPSTAFGSMGSDSPLGYQCLSFAQRPCMVQSLYPIHKDSSPTCLEEMLIFIVH